MFQLDNILEYWATIYKPIAHDPAAKSKDKRFFRIQEIDMQSEWSRNMNTIDKPCLLFRNAIEAELDKQNPKHVRYFWGVYLVVKQKGVPNNVVDELGASDCKRRLNEMVIDLLAWLDDLRTKAGNGRTDASNPFFSLTDRETREGLRGLRLEETAWWTTPVHLNGWWILGLELHCLDPRLLCVNAEKYIEPENTP